MDGWMDFTSPLKALKMRRPEEFVYKGHAAKDSQSCDTRNSASLDSKTNLAYIEKTITVDAQSRQSMDAKLLFCVLI